MAYVDLTVRTGSATLLDDTLQQLPMCHARVMDDSWNGETCVVRVLENVGFVRFALENQGYGTVLAEETHD